MLQSSDPLFISRIRYLIIFMVLNPDSNERITFIDLRGVIDHAYNSLCQGAGIAEQKSDH